VGRRVGGDQTSHLANKTEGRLKKWIKRPKICSRAFTRSEEYKLGEGSLSARMCTNSHI